MPHVLMSGLSVDRVELNVARGLVAAGFELHVINDPDTPAGILCREMGIPHVDHAFRHRFDREAIRMYRHLLAETHFDIIHCLKNRALSTALHATRRMRKPPPIVAYRGTMGHLSRFDPASRLSYLHPRVASIICVSDAVRGYMKTLRIPDERLDVIWKGHDPSWYTPAPRAALDEFGIPGHAVTACFTGNIRPVKGINYLLDAFETITPEENIHLLIIGEVRDRRIAARTSRHPCVHFAGFRRDAAALAGACDISVMPSIDREGLPKATIESMAQGIPVVATRVGGLAELVEDGTCGLLVPPRDAGALARAIRQLAVDPARRRALGDAARRRIEGPFHIRHTLEKTIALYRRLLVVLLCLVLPVEARENVTPDVEILPMVEAINHALRHNRDILRAELAADEAEIAVSEANADFDFRWGPEAGITTSGDSDGHFYGAQLRRRFPWGGEAGLRGGFSSEGDAEGAYMQMDLRQPLFRNAGTLVNLEPSVQARLASLDARRSLYQRKMDLIIDVVRGYETVLRYERQVEMDEQAVKRLNDLGRLTRAREDTGGATRLDSLRVELQQGEAQAALESSRELLALEQDDFFNLIGWSQLKEVAFVLPPLLEIDPPPLEEALATAFSNRLDYARVLDQLDTAERKVLIARKNLWPDITAIGNYRMAGGLDGRRSTDLAEESWFAGLAVEPDLNRYEQKAGLNRSVNLRDQARITLTDLDYAIERDIKQQMRAYQRADVNYRISIRNAELARKRLQLAESMFRLGQGDNFSVTDAESAHAIAIATELQDRAEASLAGYRLLNALGRLLEIPDEIKPQH